MWWLFLIALTPLILDYVQRPAVHKRTRKATRDDRPMAVRQAHAQRAADFAAGADSVSVWAWFTWGAVLGALATAMLGWML